MKGMVQKKRVLSFVAVLFILALISASFPADDQLLGKSGSFDHPAVINRLSHIDLGLCLIKTSALFKIPFTVPKDEASSGATRAPPA